MWLKQHGYQDTKIRNIRLSLSGIPLFMPIVPRISLPATLNVVRVVTTVLDYPLAEHVLTNFKPTVTHEQLVLVPQGTSSFSSEKEHFGIKTI